MPFLKSAWPSWNAELDKRRRQLVAELDGTRIDDFAPFIDQEVLARSQAFLTGIERYRNHPFCRPDLDLPVIWSEGTTRLIDYGPPTGRPVLVIPSLINRSYILDLLPGCSLLRFLSRNGLRPLLVDWGAPGDLERGFDLSDYIAGRLEAALTATLAVTGQRPSLLGYCMGGLLALGLTTRRPQDVDRLVLMATPWDFHGGAAGRTSLKTLAPLLPDLFRLWGEIPTDALQAVFALRDPQLAPRKFAHFAGLDPESEEARRFVAIEDWLNDGVPLALGAAQDSLIGWYAENRPVNGKWLVVGRPVDISTLDHPALLVIPTTDRLVPPETARALASQLKSSKSIEVALGHIGIITAKHACELVWDAILYHLNP